MAQLRHIKDARNRPGYTLRNGTFSTSGQMEQLIDIKEDGSFKMNMDYFAYDYGLTMTNDKFSRLFGAPPRQPESKLTQKEMDLAATVQKVTETVAIDSSSERAGSSSAGPGGARASVSATHNRAEATATMIERKAAAQTAAGMSANPGRPRRITIRSGSARRSPRARGSTARRTRGTG